MKQATHALPGLHLTDHEFELPVDYANPGTGTLRVFVREVVAPGKDTRDLPCVVFFQGGPGSGSPRPMTNSGWIKRMSKDYRVLLLDQRGTGISTPVTAQALRKLAPEAQAAVMTVDPVWFAPLTVGVQLVNVPVVCVGRATS